MPRWTFLTNHGAVLALIARHGQITAREIAAELGITERSVQRIITELATEQYVVRHRLGRVNWYKVNHDMPMRRPEVRDTVVGDLLGVLKPAGDAEGQ